MRRSLLVLPFLFFGIVILCVIGGYINFRGRSESRVYEVNEVARFIQSGRINQVIVEGDGLYLTFKDGSEGLAYKSSDSSLVEQLSALGVSREMLASENMVILERPQSIWLALAVWLGYLVPLIIIMIPVFGVIWFFIIKRRLK